MSSYTAKLSRPDVVSCPAMRKVTIWLQTDSSDSFSPVTGSSALSIVSRMSHSPSGSGFRRRSSMKSCAMERISAMASS